MLKVVLFLAGHAATLVCGRTVHSVLVFSRHGDRTSKVFSGYQMTNLGATQCYNSGQFYRDLYITPNAPSQVSGINPDDASYSQLWASAPDEPVLFQTALNFLQGLYPPLGQLNADLATETLVNGTDVEAPLNGYQYIHIEGEAENAPDTIWLKGDNECPAWTNASGTYKKSEQYQTTLNATRGFYAQFVPLLGEILGTENVSYARAYDVFDLLNTAYTQNASIAADMDSAAIDQSRYLANEWEWNMNYNDLSPDRSIGGESLAGGILRHLETVVEDEAATKFSLMTGSYDTFLAFFGIAGLPTVSDDFTGLPNYASTLAFELFSDADNAAFPSPENVDQELRVRFLFRNGTAAAEDLTPYPLFGEESEALSYGDFADQLRERAITSVDEWCHRCGATEDFCVAATAGDGDELAEATGQQQPQHRADLSNAAAGAIGAGVTLAVVVFVGLIVWAALRKRKTGGVNSAEVEKRFSDGGSGSDRV